jgi:hypothetical protein
MAPAGTPRSVVIHFDFIQVTEEDLRDVADEIKQVADDIQRWSIALATRLGRVRTVEVDASGALRLD